MTMSGVNNKKLLQKNKYSKKGKSLKVNKNTPGTRKTSKKSDLWEDFLVKNVKTKIKKLNILKREKGNNYSISINNNNFNNNINLINPGIIKSKKLNQKKKSRSPKLDQNYRRTNMKKAQIIKKKGIRNSNSQNIKKIKTSKSNGLKRGHLPRKMHSMKATRNPSNNMKMSQFKTQKIANKNKIQLDLVKKQGLLNSSSRIKSSRMMSKKFHKSKPVSSVLQKITKKANIKNLALNLPLHPKIPRILNFNKPILNMDKSKYLLAAGYLNKNVNISQIKSERQKAYMNAESLHCKQKKKVRSQCVNTSRKLRDSRTWLVSEDKISSHSKSLLRIKEKLKKKTDYYKLNNFLKKIKDRNHQDKKQKINTSRPKKSKFESEIKKQLKSEPGNKGNGARINS